MQTDITACNATAGTMAAGLEPTNSWLEVSLATVLKIATARPSQSHGVMVVPVSYLKTVTFIPS